MISQAACNEATAVETRAARRKRRQPLVLVTALEYEKAEPVFRACRTLRCLPAPAQEDALAAEIRRQGARHVVVGVERYAAALYPALPRGGVIARFGVGYDGLDLAQAQQHGLLCTNTPNALDDTVAEHAAALLLAAARGVPAQACAVRRGLWLPRMGHSLRGRHLAVIGCGGIGCRLARLASRGLGMRVTGCNRTLSDPRALRRRGGFKTLTSDYEAAVAAADYVSLHIPATPENYLFLNRERLRRIPSHAWLINTSRGSILDEAALCHALQGGTLAGAALDVYQAEPYQPVTPQADLRRFDNVIMTPHTASSTYEACERVARQCLRNILLAERGRPAAMDLIGQRKS